MSAASWSIGAPGMAVFTMIETFLGGVVMLGLSETRPRRHGRRMGGTGMHDAPLASTRSVACVHECNYRTRPELGVEMLRIQCAARDTRRFHVIADSANGGQNVLNSIGTWSPICRTTVI